MLFTKFMTMAAILVQTSVFASQKYWDKSITILVPEGQEDCYFVQDVKINQEVDVEYQVTNTKSVYTSGDLKIAARIHDPRGAILHNVDSADYGSHYFEASMDGDYKVCLDNRYVSSGDKTVYLEFEVSEKTKEKTGGGNDGTKPDVADLPTNEEDEFKDQDDDDVYNYEYEGDDYIGEEDMKHMREQDKEIVKSFDLKVSDIKSVLQQIRHHMGKAEHYQSLINSVKTHDYHHLMSSLQRVNMWSFVHISVLIFTGLVQVYVVRSLFDDKMNVVRKVFGSSR